MHAFGPAGDANFVPLPDPVYAAFISRYSPLSTTLLLLWGSFRPQVCYAIQIPYNIGNVALIHDVLRHAGPIILGGAGTSTN